MVPVDREGMMGEIADFRLVCRTRMFIVLHVCLTITRIVLF